MLLRCTRQAYQDVLSLVEVTSLVYTILRLKTAVYEAWMEGRVVLCKSVRQRLENISDYRQVLSDLIELWPSIRPFVRCTGYPEAKDKADRLSYICVETDMGIFKMSSLVCFLFNSLLLLFLAEGD